MSSNEPICVHHWVFLSLGWKHHTTAVLGLCKCLHHQVFVLLSVRMRAHRRAECVLLYLKTLIPWVTLLDKGGKGMKSPSAWISWGGQTTAVPQGPFSRKVHSHGPLNWLGGTVIISVYLWKETRIQNSSKGILCFNAFHRPGEPSQSLLDQCTMLERHQHRKGAAVQEQVWSRLFSCL